MENQKENEVDSTRKIWIILEPAGIGFGELRIRSRDPFHDSGLPEGGSLLLPSGTGTNF